VEQELLILYGVIVVSPFVLFLLAIVLPVDLRILITSGIFKLCFYFGADNKLCCQCLWIVNS
jgi:hypothetical protein